MTHNATNCASVELYIPCLAFAASPGEVWKLCEEDLPYIASDSPPDRSHGTVVLAAELYVCGAVPAADPATALS